MISEYDLDFLSSKGEHIEMNIPLNKLGSNVITKSEIRQPKLKGKYKGGAGLRFQNINITPFLINEWLQIPSHAGFETTTLSIFNPSFLKLFDIDGVETYICTCRVIYHYEHNEENTERVKSGGIQRPMNNEERDRAYSLLKGQYIIGNQGPDESKQNDDHPYIIHPGSALAAPWYNPRGFWGRGGRKDYTDQSMVCVLRLTDREIIGIHRFIPAYHGSCPKDARVFSVHSEIIENRKVFTLFITGSIRRNDISKGIELSDRRNFLNTIDPSSTDANFNGNWVKPASYAWKHGLLRLKYFFNEDGTVNHVESINDIGSGVRTWVRAKNNG